MNWTGQPTLMQSTRRVSPMHRLYHLYILHYHFALCTFQTHTHTQAQEHYLALSIHTSTRKLYFFALSTPAAQEHFPPGHRHIDTVTIIAFSTHSCICTQKIGR